MAQSLDLHPHLPLLQWLARGSLKQNLLRAIRLWVWLRFLYNPNKNRLLLLDSFTYADWRDSFFTPSHPKGEEIPHLHDRLCACAKTTAEWLFHPDTGVIESEWRHSLQQHDEISDESLDELLQRRLFGMTRRSLLADLHILTEIGWLNYQNKTYHLVKTFPTFPATADANPESQQLNRYELNFLHPDLENIAQTYSREVGEIQRFFLHVDYIIPHTALDRVDDLQEKLREFWEEKTVPPIRFIYHSAKYGSVECIVYPACIYYCQRAVYLCAFGRNPQGAQNWYNYRLDRIFQLSKLHWNAPEIPSTLQQLYRRKTLPVPDYIQAQMALAWGFDFYEERQLMLLRFDREFSDRYIQNTERHETFQSLTYQQAEQVIKQFASASEQLELLKILKSRSPQDAYYRVFYRKNDPNVGLRLRSWRPKAEVLMPLELRRQIAKEVAAESLLYGD